MKKVFLYNPENDIALAHGAANFTPPKQAVALSRYAASVMWWVAGEGDYVVVADDMEGGYMDALGRWREDVTFRFGAGAAVVSSVKGIEVNEAMPWGWSRHALRRLGDAGVEKVILEKWEGRMERLRQLSHRRTATVINSRICEMIDFGRYGQPCPDGGIEASDAPAVMSYAAAHGGRFYFKLPWSSTGRGVRRVGSDAEMKMLLQQLPGMKKAQGSVMLEPDYDKTDDFAMLFEARGGVVRHVGYSLFFNVHGGAYGGNVLASDNVIIDILGRKVPVQLLDEVAEALETALSEVIGGDYEGFLGVDMMIARCGDGGHMLVPCVEVNLRMTMGIVAHKVVERTGMDDGSSVMRMAVGGQRDGALLDIVPRNKMFGIEVIPIVRFQSR